jgi:uncharacterized Zn finger protein (UPF0148 family)
MSADPIPACSSCGTPWTEHLGIVYTCAKCQDALAQRDEARALVRRIMATQHLGEDSQEKYDALTAAWRAVMGWGKENL